MFEKLKHHLGEPNAAPHRPETSHEWQVVYKGQEIAVYNNAALGCAALGVWSVGASAEVSESLLNSFAQHIDVESSWMSNAPSGDSMFELPF